MKLIVGLGNPGQRYSQTRHNFGWMVVDELCKNIKARHLQTTDLYELHRKSDFLIAKPLTFMNRSGIAVRHILNDRNIKYSDTIIVLDDINLSLDRIRIRAGGSSGGHNGLASIIEENGTTDIPRIRLGIRNDLLMTQYTDLAEFVLDDFDEHELPIVTSTKERACKAIMMIMDEGLDKAMSVYNQESN